MRTSVNSAALVMAPLGGASAIFLAYVITSILVGFEYVRPIDALQDALGVALLALLPSTFFTALVAAAALVYERLCRRPLPLLLAVSINAAVAAIPLVLAAFLCALVTAWIYWRVRGRA